ncbi:MAG: alanine--tRNA ligase [Myxococcales bacterium]|nr:alanine--tRNA ligase [Myxococcales bacterium]
MKSAAIRSAFLDYFRRHGHDVVASSPLVPQGDPTLLFTNAGMVQFKDVFTGREKRASRRACSSQKCVRAGGKHNDLENVGRTARHHTFFEMLGNFSFGDYFKEGAIVFAWELLTKELAIDPGRMVITVFGGDPSLGLGPDDEARALWKKVTGFSDSRIIGLGMKDNFWMMGDTGPQGPCSELHYFIGPKAGSGGADPGTFGDEPAPDGTGWMEIWNLVFMQFEKATRESPLVPLPAPSIDTGAGLERLAAVIQGKGSNYDTDLLLPLIDQVAETTRKAYRGTMSDDDVSMRVLADHARAAAFLIGDGVTPSNEGRGYVLRRIMRRAIRHGVRLGLDSAHYARLIDQVGEVMGDAYPELGERRATIRQFVVAEDLAFRRTLDRGLQLLDEEVVRLGAAKVIPGPVVFKLYDTYGFPADLTRVIAEERGLAVDEAGFDAEMEQQRAKSADFGGSGEETVDLRQQYEATRFLGYEATTARGRILDFTPLKAGGAWLIADQTPFYGEAGGQVGDSGTITTDDFEFLVEKTLKSRSGVIVHEGRLVKGSPSAGAEADFAVDVGRRDAIRANHSATHLLHLALKEVLGDHVAQKGSLVAPDRLRFDFSHFAPMTDEDKRRVEDRVNDEIRGNADSQVEVKSFDEARRSGAVALFGEKYGDTVRVMRIGSRSIELCGGTHVRRAGDIGLFKIVAEIGIAQGVRRIEAVTGAGALDYVRRIEAELGRAGGALRGSPFEVAAKVEKLQKELREREREVEELRHKLAAGGGRDLLAGAREIDGVRVLAARSDIGDPKALREVAVELREKIKSGIVVLGGVAEGKVALVATVTSDLVGRYHAGKLVAALSAAVGGKGGGRPDLAQGGGTETGALDAALEQVYALVGKEPSPSKAQG